MNRGCYLIPALTQGPFPATDRAVPKSCASLLRVLADPTRLRIVEELMAGPLHVGAINQRVRLQQSLLSHHLKVLRQAKLVAAERDGKAVLYRLTCKPTGKGAGRVIDLGCCRLSFE